MNAADLIRERIAASTLQMLTWHEVMRIALYEPGIGYYRHGVRRIGRSGDFFTSVSVGPLFGALLAEYTASLWNQLGQPVDFTLLEQGAHDGTLAKDVLTALQARHRELFEAVQYVIIEPDAIFRETQRGTLREFADQLIHAQSWQELPTTKNGLLLANELLDAFPVHRVEFTQDGWRELHVRLDEAGAFQFVAGPVTNEALQEELRRLGQDFAVGYITELNLDMLSWLRGIAASQFQGAILMADYGHAGREYYAPERSKGTLRRYFQHQSDAHILQDLGEADLTAHVNFTRVAEEAQMLGFAVTEFIEQGRFLTRVTTGLMQQPDFQPDAAWMRQFQTLTHPSHLGHAFQVITLTKGLKLTVDEQQRDAARRRLGLEA